MTTILDDDAASGLNHPRRDWVDRRIYIDPEVLRLENAALFTRSWMYVGHESEIRNSGDYLTVTVAGQPIVVARDRTGSVNAFYNTCSHRAVQIAREARGNCANTLKCIYHGWSYDLTGRCVGVPHFQAYGKDFDRSEFDIPRVHIDTFHGLIFVALDPLVPTLAEFLEGIADDLEAAVRDTEVIGRISYIVKGNWKMWHENFADGYHPPFTHQMVRDIEDDYPGDGVNEHVGNGHTVLTWDVNPPRFDRINASMMAITGLSHDVTANPDYYPTPYPKRPTRQLGAKQQYRIFTLFPNLDFQDTSSTVKIEILHPISPSETRVEVVMLGSTDDTSEHRAWRLRHSGLSGHTSGGKIAADDNEAIAFAQLGMSAVGVPLSSISRGQQPGDVGGTRDEHGIRGFYERWAVYMESDPEHGFDAEHATVYGSRQR